MIPALLSAIAVLLIWSILASKLEAWYISAPIAMLLGGLIVGFSTTNDIGFALNTEIASKIAELILAMHLFMDAFEVKGGVFGHDRWAAARLLFIALPLSVAATVVLGLVLLPQIGWVVLLAMACAIVPTDMAPVSSVLKDRRIPSKVTNLLNVESGFNDGVVAPFFIFALTLAGNRSHASNPESALLLAIPSAVIAILTGITVGLATGYLMKMLQKRGWTTSRALSLGLVAVPLLAYAVSVSFHGNGFVAAFVCGIAFHAARGSVAQREAAVAEDVTTILGLATWFVLGCVTVAVAYFGIGWQELVIAVAVLTVLRIGPVYVSLIGTSFSPRERLLLGALGPRGIATIVLALLAYNALEGGLAGLQLSAMVCAVLLSLLLHGFGVPIFTKWHDRSKQISV